MRDMLILGIETSGPRGSIAVCRGDACLAECPLEAGRRHAQTLVGEIDAALRRLGIRPRDFHAVAVSVGPGSFTGLRVGVVCAKTMAYASGCRLAAVDTLQAIAENCPADVQRVHGIANAQRGDLYVGTYRRSSAGDWIRERPVAIVAAEPWLASRGPAETLSGPGLSAYGSRVPTACRTLPETAWTPRALAVAHIGRRQIEAGGLADCATLEPFYLRRAAAEERRNPHPPDSGRFDGSVAESPI